MILVNIQAIREAAAGRPAGYAEDLLAAGEIQGQFVAIPDVAYDALVLKYQGVIRLCGPGCQLKRLLAKAGFRSVPGCKCDARAAIMDEWGADGCAPPERRTEILGWLKEEADRRGLPFSAAGAAALLTLAIALARANARKVARHRS